MLRLVGIGLVLAVLMSAPAASAQRNVDLGRFSPALDQDGFLGVQGTRTPGHLKLNLSLFSDYASHLLSVEAPSGGSVAAVEHRITTRLMAQLGLGRRMALAVDVPFVPYQQGEQTALDDSEVGAAFGDPRLIWRGRLIGEAADERVLRRDGPGLSVQLGAQLPLGGDDSYLGEGALRTQLGLLADFQIFGAGVGLSLDWQHRFATRELFSVRVRDELGLGIAAKLPIPSLPSWVPIVELQVRTDAGAPFSDQTTTSVEGDLGLRILLDAFALSFAVGTGFTDAVGTPGVRALFGVQWTPRSADSDGDGISDSDDGCPPLPEDVDGFQDADGCPDPDNDNDLINDVDDLCPNDEALEGQDDDEDGCTDP